MNIAISYEIGFDLQQEEVPDIIVIFSFDSDFGYLADKIKRREKNVGGSHG